MVFPTAVQDETLAPPPGVGMWGRALGTRLSCVINIIVCFFSCLIHARKTAQLHSSFGLWCSANSQQPDSSVQAEAETKAGEVTAKVFPCPRAAQKRLFLEALWRGDFALSSLNLNEFVFASDIFTPFITL